MAPKSHDKDEGGGGAQGVAPKSHDRDEGRYKEWLQSHTTGMRGGGTRSGSKVT